MPAQGTLSDLASERPKDSYIRRTARKGLGMLPRPDCLTGLEIVQGSALVHYRFDARRHLARQGLVNKDAAKAA